MIFYQEEAGSEQFDKGRRNMMNATAHHIGCAVDRLEQNYATFAGGLGLQRRSRTFEVASQHVRVCFVELGHQFYLELIEPIGPAAKLAAYLRVGFYHLCFLVGNLDTAREHLIEHRFIGLPVFESEAFAGAPCQFFISPQSHLIELAQMSTISFDEFFHGNLVVGS